MIRAVPFEYFSSGRADHIAFVCTITDRFLEFDGDQYWATWSELFESMTCDNAYPDGSAVEPDFMLRLKRLCPMWFLDNHEEWRAEI